jgi:hypothetical protein
MVAKLKLKGVRATTRSGACSSIMHPCELSAFDVGSPKE